MIPNCYTPTHTGTCPQLIEIGDSSSILRLVISYVKTNFSCIQRRLFLYLEIVKCHAFMSVVGWYIAYVQKGYKSAIHYSRT